MLPLQTKVQIPQPGFFINYEQVVSLFGSCFSDHIGEKLLRYKFKACPNPFGVLYNPASIINALTLLTHKEAFTENNLQHRNDLWFSFLHHTSFSHPDKLSCLERINTRFATAKSQFEQSEIIILTLGTAFIYRLKSTGQVVANCHKIPDSEFTREFLSPEQIAELMSHEIGRLNLSKPGIRFIFTVSPIRHWKDGAIENQRSKASLVLAIRLLERAHENCYYFPTYEIFMDELRDYRFYASDMLHPSDFAVDYIWEAFTHTFFDTPTQQLMKKVQKITKSYQHRSFNKNTPAHKSFVEKLIEETDKLCELHSYLDFSTEKHNLLNNF
ncbi:MAG: GSCFA domain-containing protein [Bacteroidota bacterium]|nr:MAG: GSCFA domain-containing protein [Bacteroidota bacterium]